MEDPNSAFSAQEKTVENETVVLVENKKHPEGLDSHK